MCVSSSNRNSASARASSVLPTPVGPRNMNEPIGRLGSCEPGARAADGVGDRLDRLVLADDARVQPLLHVQQLAPARPRASCRRGCPSTCDDDRGDVLLGDLFAQERCRAFCSCARARAGLAASCFSSSGMRAVAQLGRLSRSPRALRQLALGLGGSSICSFSSRMLADDLLLALPLRPHRVDAARCSSAISARELRQPLRATPCPSPCRSACSSISSDVSAPLELVDRRRQASRSPS